MASNSEGIFSGGSAGIDFSVAPAYYQTGWFQVSCVAAFLLSLWVLHRLRLRQIAQEFNIRLEERVGERTRIARELHDTLLQSFQALMFHFQAVKDQLPPGRGQEALETVLGRADQAIAEGREAIQDLRSYTKSGEELAGTKNGEHGPAAFRISIEGPPRNLTRLPATTFTALRARHCKMPSATRRQVRSKRRLHMAK
jgi:signal transduction histidine kinase